MPEGGSNLLIQSASCKFRSTLLDITPTVNGVSASTKSYSSMSSSRGPADSLGGSYEDVSNKRSNLSTTESTLTAHTLEHSDDEDVRH